MKKNTLFSAGMLYVIIASIQTTVAEGESGVTGLLSGIESTTRIREGDIHLEDIPNVINAMINIFLGMAGTIAVIFVIIGAYKLLFGSLKQDHTKGRETIVMALTGFAISVLAWFIVKFIFNNFSG